jgi:ACS family hexuronate transporter-like MFS transporter
MITSSPNSESARATRYRWIICGLLFFGLVINYVDRQMLGVLKPTLSKEFGWSEVEYADIVFWFQAAYAVGYLVFGRVVDKVGAKIGYTVAFTIWNLAHIAHAFAGSLTQFIWTRVALGLGESGVFPAGIKAVAEWFPRKERALATGIFNAGSNIGAIVTPLIVPAITIAYGWEWAFIITGLVSFIWLAAWLIMYRAPDRHARVNAVELDHIRQDPPDVGAPAPWSTVVRTREAWAYALGKFLIDPIWWFFLFWLPGYLVERYGLDLKTFGPPLVVIYLMSDIGSIAGGWFSSRLINGGMAIGRARKFTMLICALCVVPIIGAQFISELWIAVGVIGLATAAHQGFSANLYTLPSDVFPRNAVGSVVGIGGTVGAIGGMVFSKYVGQVLDQLGTYTPIFIVAGSVYLLAVLVVQLLSPRYDPANIDR